MKGAANPIRRRLVAAGGVFFAAACGFDAEAGALRRSARIVLHSLATGEEVDLEYRCAGMPVPAALARIDAVLRDPLTGASASMDVRLIDFLHASARALAVPPEFDVLGAFESPRAGRAAPGAAPAAPASLHGSGRAIDARLRGVSSAAFAAGAAGLSRGGVGHYRAGEFVHVDTGRPRQWRG